MVSYVKGVTQSKQYIPKNYGKQETVWEYI